MRTLSLAEKFAVRLVLKIRAQREKKKRREYIRVVPSTPFIPQEEVGVGRGESSRSVHGKLEEGEISVLS